MSRHLLALLAGSFLAFAMMDGAASAKPCPNIMLVLDQSGSMAEDPFGHQPDSMEFKGPSKWQLLQQVVTDIVTRYGDHVPFGLELFSGGHNTRPPLPPDDACFAQSMITAPVAHDSAGTILAAIRAAKPEGNTGTNGAIRRARSDTGLMDPKKGNFIVLVTDGNPNCGTDAAQGNAGEDLSLTGGGGTLDEILAAYKQKPSIKTFVIGFDGDPMGVKFANLDAMGFEGLGGGQQPCTQPPNHCYYQAGVNFADFQKVFDTIVTSVGGGEFGGELCDDSCYSNPCPAGQVCTTNEQNLAPHCENDQCMGAKCDGGTFCRLGKCIKACESKCAAGTICTDGTCQVDLCNGKMCAASQVCNPKTGSCIDYPCPTCNDKGAYCDVATGKCLSDGCKTHTISCPSDFVCVNHNNCEGGSGGGSCAVGPVGARGFDGRTLFAASMLLVSLGMMLRRRSRRTA